jgi:hypothetical protein
MNATTKTHAYNVSRTKNFIGKSIKDISNIVNDTIVTNKLDRLDRIEYNTKYRDISMQDISTSKMASHIATIKLLHCIGFASIFDSQ